MSFVPAPALDERSTSASLGGGSLLTERPSILKPRRSIATLLVSIGNADPTGRIEIEFDSAHGDMIHFDHGPDAVPPRVVAFGPAPEFVAVDRNSVQVVISAGQRYTGPPIGMSILIPVSFDVELDSVRLSADAAPGTAMEAVLDGHPAVDLTSGRAEINLL